MVRSTVEAIPGAGRAMVVDASAGPGDPVLLYLHGKGESSLLPDDLLLVCRHVSPPLQALSGTLAAVTVVAPQAPHPPDQDWRWATYAPALRDYLGRLGRPVLAAGFSRGGLGVLQLCRAAPGLITRWAVVDPQAAGAEEEAGLLSLKVAGWLRFGDELGRNTPFARRLAGTLDPAHTRFLPGARHVELAVAAFGGDPLEGAQTLYRFLGLPYDATAMVPSSERPPPGPAGTTSAPGTSGPGTASSRT